MTHEQVRELERGKRRTSRLGTEKGGSLEARGTGRSGTSGQAGRGRAEAVQMKKLIYLLASLRGRVSQPPGDLSEVVRLLTELRTYYMQRDDPNGANWCEKVITEAKELEKL